MLYLANFLSLLGLAIYLEPGMLATATILLMGCHHISTFMGSLRRSRCRAHGVRKIRHAARP
ncbi:hypothetical protein [Burkholderia sp. BCC1998]|uniref:hypothetical protein n=1 Tax=Burkholderia sp. BCC1998 TaxID=2817447 RepID=UPI002AB6951B|nr:hypothetical protein [Burkholderia sp. BCC1998]